MGSCVEDLLAFCEGLLHLGLGVLWGCFMGSFLLFFGNLLVVLEFYVYYYGYEQGGLCILLREFRIRFSMIKSSL